MTSQREIFATAKLLMEPHGLKGATGHALDRIVELTEDGGRQGAFVWGQIRAPLPDLSGIEFSTDVEHKNGLR